MYPVKTPNWIKRFLPKYICCDYYPHKKESEAIGEGEDKSPTIYLTFDDGPIPDVTPWVLNQLAAYEAKATFFCIGKNIVENPSIFESIQQAGHRVGNHTQNHLNGWKTPTSNYVENVKKCAKVCPSLLFRPPYGKMTWKQANLVKQTLGKSSKIILWDVLSGDFDQNITAEKCLNNVLTHTVDGSIIVFHDSLKAAPHLYAVLPKVLAHFSQKGFLFKACH